ncbi:hypothetical protein BV20DRAFT_563439 [Pilatotrama ljubarskyi]|nr:hypothetical protein BV20DRAFT_563439 [Pilatotrama ljubarskyi]
MSTGTPMLSRLGIILCSQTWATPTLRAKRKLSVDTTEAGFSLCNYIQKALCTLKASTFGPCPFRSVPDRTTLETTQTTQDPNNCRYSWLRSLHPRGSRLRQCIVLLHKVGTVALQIRRLRSGPAHFDTFPTYAPDQPRCVLQDTPPAISCCSGGIPHACTRM